MSPTATPRTAWVALGGNLGDAVATVRAAWRALGDLQGCRAVACSSLYRSAPVEASGPDFINAVAQLETTLEPLALLDALQALELRFGRERPWRNAPRTLDLDLLAIDDLVLQHARLVLPHPRAHLRAFVLQPWAELAPSLLLPGHGSLTALLPSVADQVLSRLSPGNPAC